MTSVHLVGFYSLLSSLMHGTMNLKFSGLVVQTCRVLYQINMRNSASRWLSLYEFDYKYILLLYNLSYISDKIYNANML
jgi:hypothetical protein